MANPTLSASERNWRNWMRLCAGIIVVLPLLSLAGRALGSRELAAIFPGGNPMAGNSALCQILLGVACWLIGDGRRRAAAACGWIVFGFSLLIGSQHVFGVTLGIDELFIRHTLPPPQAYPGRLAPNTALCFVLAGSTLALITRPRIPGVVVTLTAGLLLGFSLMAVLSYATGLRLVLVGTVSFGMSLATAVGMTVVAIAAIFSMERHAPAPQPARPLAITAVMLLTSVGLFTFHLNEDHRQANAAENRSYEVVASLNYIELCLTRMQSAARAYALTGEPRYVAFKDDIGARLRVELNHLDFLTTDVPATQPALATLRSLAGGMRGQVDALVAVHAQGDAAAVAAASDATSASLALVREHVNLLERAERRRQRENDELVRTTSVKTIQVVLLGNVLAGLFTFSALYLSRRAEEARARTATRLRDAHRFQRAVLDGTVLSVIATESDGTIREFNRGAEQMLGYRREEMIDRRTPEVLHLPEELAARAGEVAEATAGTTPPAGFGVLVALARWQEVDEREWTYVRKDGSRLPVWLSVTMLRDEAGAMSGLLAIATDLTERKATEAALRSGEQRLAGIIRSMAEGLVVLEAGGGIIVCNAAAGRILGLDETAIIGRTWDDSRWSVVRPDGSPMPHEDVPSGDTLRTGRPHRGVEVGVNRADGSRVWISLNTDLLHDEAGRRYVVCTFTDVSERRALMASLAAARDGAVAASRLKSEFLANMSHEIRTPLNGILGMTGLLLETPLDERQRPMAQVVKSSGENLLTIIDEILDLSKIEAGKLNVEALPFELERVMEEARVLLQPRIDAKGLVLEVEAADTRDRHVIGDAGRLRQVLLNLLANAIKFTDHGVVKLIARTTPAANERLQVRIEVRDTGIGIPAAAKSRLFQPFTQADGTVTRRFGGTGLGLAISRQLVELMGGRIGFESEEGSGSMFWVELEFPRADPAPEAPAAAAPVAPMPAPAALAAAAPSTRGLRVLVAEDNPTNQTVARLMLERMGCEVEVAPDGAAALERLGARPFAVVLMDCQMPVLDGYATTRKIREGAVPGLNRNLPVIALTAHAMPEDRKRCLEAGMTDYLAKPIRLTELAAAFARCGIRQEAPAAPAPAAPAATESGVLDAAQVAQLRALSGVTHPQLFDDLVEIIRREAPGILAEIAALAEQQQRDALVRVAHRLAGSAANLGAPGLRAAALAVEAAAKAEDWSRVAERVRILDREWERLRFALGTVSSKGAP